MSLTLASFDRDQLRGADEKRRPSKQLLNYFVLVTHSVDTCSTLQHFAIVLRRATLVLLQGPPPLRYRACQRQFRPMVARRRGIPSHWPIARRVWWRRAIFEPTSHRLPPVWRRRCNLRSECRAHRDRKSTRLNSS